jgi:hypothetical protein
MEESPYDVPSDLEIDFDVVIPTWKEPLSRPIVLGMAALSLRLFLAAPARRLLRVLRPGRGIGSKT